MVIGTGPFGEDILYKEPSINHINTKHDILISSRIDWRQKECPRMKDVIGNSESTDIIRKCASLKNKVASFDYIYDNVPLLDEVDMEDVAFCQIDFPFSYDFLVHMDKNYYKKN